MWDKLILEITKPLLILINSSVITYSPHLFLIKNQPQYKANWLSVCVTNIVQANFYFINEQPFYIGYLI